MRNPMRIAMISEHASPLAASGGVDAGGQNVYVSQVARCLAQAGHDVDILTRRDDPSTPTVTTMRPGVRVIQVPAGPPEFIPKEKLLPYMPAFMRAAQSLMRLGPRPDIVHANFFMSGLVAQQLRDRLDIPYVITFHALGLVRREHQQEADAFPAARTEIERMLSHEADAVIAECPQDQMDLVRLYDADARRMRTIPCGYNAREFGPMNKGRARAKLGLSSDDYVILQLGRLVPRKGVDDVIRSLAHLPASVPARLVIVGGETTHPDEERTPEIRRLRQVAQACGVANRVVFLGRRQRDELRTCYAAADVFATTPWYEPFGITPLEAMACGVPVVASAVGGLQHSVKDGVTGFLVPPRDPAALAQRLAELHANPRLAQAMGRAGMHRVRSLFTWERVANMLQNAYEDVLRTHETATRRSAIFIASPLTDNVVTAGRQAINDAIALN